MPMESVKAGNSTKNEKDGADYWLKYFGEIPEYYITKEELIKYGWSNGKNPSKFAPGRMYFKGVYSNSDGHLPDTPGIIWYEADINYYGGRRNRHRVLWSNNGSFLILIFNL